MMMNRRFILIFLICLLFSCQKEEEEIKPFYTNKILKGITWEVYGKETGLHSDFIVCLTSDEFGNIWVGTFSSGIAKYDGASWTAFHTSNSGLPNDSIYDITCDKYNDVWIGTKNGLANYNGDEWTVYKDDDLPGISNLIRSLSVDMDNNKWIAYGHHDEGGLIKFDDNTWTLFTPENSLLQSRTIHKILVDEGNRIWLGTGNGLVRINRGFWKVFNKDNSILPYHQIWNVCTDYNGSIWIGLNAMYFMNSTYYHGSLLRYDGKFWHEYKPIKSGKTSNRVLGITTDNFRNIWVATGEENIYNYEISMFNGQEWFVLSDIDPTFPHPFVLDIILDKNNILWVGGIGVGLIKIEMEFE